jgi:hypothetical protein
MACGETFRSYLAVMVTLVMLSTGCTSTVSPTRTEVAVEEEPAISFQGTAVGEVSAAPSRFDAEHPNEFFHFFLGSPPPGTLSIVEHYDGVGTDGRFAVEVIILTSSTRNMGRTAAISGNEYVEFHSEDANLSVRCCPMEHGGRGGGQIVRNIDENMSWLEVWFIVAGWKPNEEAWFEIALRGDDGKHYAVPLLERGADLAVVDLRQALKQHGTHVVVGGVTVLSTENTLEIEIAPPLVGSYWAAALKNELQVSTSSGNTSEMVHLEESQRRLGYVSSWIHPLKLRLSVPEDMYSMVGLMMFCACASAIEFHEVIGPEASDRGRGVRAAAVDDVTRSAESPLSDPRWV